MSFDPRRRQEFPGDLGTGDIDTMEDSQKTSIIVGSVGLALVALTSIPSLVSFCRRVLSPKRDAFDEKKLYEDEDGAATAETQKAYSAAIPRYIILASAAVGLLVSLAASILGLTQPRNSLFTERLLDFGGWAFLMLQALIIFSERGPVKRFGLGLHASLTCLVLLVSIGWESSLFGSRISSAKRFVPHIVLIAVQSAAAVILLIALLSLPRRPVVLTDGKEVDGQYTGSALNRYTFTWGGQLLDFAKKNKGLDMEDLPKLDALTRSAVLQERFNSMKKRSRLWKSIFFAHQWPFIQQYLLVIVQGITQFGPQYAMFNLLKLLEQRSKGASVAVVAWAWVFGLGLSMLIASWIEAWLFWIVWSKLGIRISSELSALIFSKAMRRKDVKGARKAKSQLAGELDGNGKSVINKASGQKGEDTAPVTNDDADEDEDESLQKSRQSTINLVGVDTKRVRDFTAFSYIFPGVAIKLIVSMSFLYTLIGWKSLLSGLAVSALITPINIYMSRKYSDAQGVLMKVRDQKMAVVTEALQGIRQIKFAALERQWQAKIGEKRTQELTAQWRIFALDTGLITIWIIGPVMLSAVSLAVYAILHGDLSPSVAFTTIAVFNAIEGTLAVIPELTTDALEAWVSVNRIEDYLNGPEKEENTMESDRIEFENVSVAWPADSDEDDPDRYILRDINIRFPNKDLSVISGKTGSGKSLLLASILGEVDKLSGVIRVPRAPSLKDRFDHKATRGNWIIDSSVAFVAQIPWIENATIKDNILFGLPLDQGRYRKTLSACALEKDLDMLPDGELTDIGANGINLSGGQRWRISFARALYSRAGIMVLDDIFSAVDTHVGRQLFENALTGELGQGRTRILVTHHIGLCLPKTKYTVILGEGTVGHAGFVEDLQRKGTLAEILKQEQDGQRKEAGEESEATNADDANGNVNGSTLQKVLSRRSEISAKLDSGELDTKGKAQPKKFTEDEKRETGSIKVGIYKEYLKTSGGWLFWPFVLGLYASYMALILGRSFWITLWTRSYHTESVVVEQIRYHYGKLQRQFSAERFTAPNNDLWYYLGVYVGLSIIICLVGSLRYFAVFIGSIKASRVLFEKLAYTVLRAPLRWLDTVPVGRILNRFTADFNIIDSRMANDIGFMLYMILQLVGIIVAGLFVSPLMLLFAVVLLSICIYIALQYLAGAREVKRLESIAKSPIFEQFGSALAGVGTIRAFDKADAYVERMFGRVDAHARAFWYLWLTNRWMGFRLNIIGAVFAIMVAAIIASLNNIDASLAGFALGFALQYTTAIVWTLRCYANTELDMNATERIVEYSRIVTEDQSGNDAPAAWPTEGCLEINNVVAGYAPDLPPVLKGLTFSVEKNQRVGVVGRTGAGKSSLTLALFRFLEAREGTIHIDGIDISKIKLQDLRGRLAIIPQDPVLFSGTVRTNLDAFDEHTDAELHDALERVHLIRSADSTPRPRGEITNQSASGSVAASGSTTPIQIDTNTNVFTSLSSRISEGGLNLSQGQRQLLCLARAIVSRPKIMVLDEATSAVDMATDVLIQRSIREEFSDSTLIVIAHRLSTIADFDKILVMSDGRAVEYGAPKQLAKAKGVFWEMVTQSGEREKLEEIIGEG